jgi:hypothetical protein
MVRIGLCSEIHDAIDARVLTYTTRRTRDFRQHIGRTTDLFQAGLQIVDNDAIGSPPFHAKRTLDFLGINGET